MYTHTHTHTRKRGYRLLLLVLQALGGTRSWDHKVAVSIKGQQEG